MTQLLQFTDKRTVLLQQPVMLNGTRDGVEQVRSDLILRRARHPLRVDRQPAARDGRAGAERFLKSGEWKVTLFDVNEEMLVTAARELGEKYGAEMAEDVVVVCPRLSPSETAGIVAGSAGSRRASVRPWAVAR